MKERPILFSGPMVRALLDGTKTQTRRVVKPQPFDRSYSKHDHRMAYASGRASAGDEIDGFYAYSTSSGGDWRAKCPYGQPGDKLWVREAVSEISCRLTYRADTDDGAHCQVKRWTPSIHMPRIWSRIFLEITGVRVERLQDISEQDAIAEGIRRVGPGWERWHPDPDDTGHTGSTQKPRLSYRGLWESINGAGSWDANPFCWVIEFKRVTP
jgi:hypothetical protein